VVSDINCIFSAVQRNDHLIEHLRKRGVDSIELPIEDLERINRILETVAIFGGDANFSEYHQIDTKTREMISKVADTIQKLGFKVENPRV
jgi:hypothetical protein